MSAYNMNAPNAICATCLSQERKMFQLPLKHNKLVSLIYKDLMLSEEDKMCWECKHFVIKMANFGNKAVRAQNTLTAMLLKEPITIQSLSKLEISKGVTLDIVTLQFDPTEENPDPLLLGTIKSETDSNPADNEPDDVELGSIEATLQRLEPVVVKPDPLLIDTMKSRTDIDLNNEADDLECNIDPANNEFGDIEPSSLQENPLQASPEVKFDPLLINTIKIKTDLDPNDEDNYAECNMEEYNANSESGDLEMKANPNVAYGVFHHKISNNERQEKVVYHTTNTVRHEKNDGNGIANATLMSLLMRQSNQFSVPPLMIEVPTLRLPTIETPKLKLPTMVVRTLKLPTMVVPPLLPISRNPTTAKYVDSNETTDKRCDSQTPIPSYTEERMTEEERQRWWKSKKEKEYYAKSIEVFRCEKCVEPFFTRRTFLGHMKMHTEMFGKLSCDVCELRFHTEVALVAHKDTHYRLLKCTRCGHAWDMPNSMRRHCNTEHSVPIASWKCDLCPRELHKHQKYLSHVRSHAVEACPYCGKLVSVNCLKTHMYTHKKVDRPYKCSQCDKRFKNKSHLQIHVSHVHSKIDDKMYCAKCDKQFKNIYSYNNHMKYAADHVSKELLTHKCGECSKAFKTASKLRRHVENKHSDELKYPCQQCNQKFKSPSSRSRHRKEVHEEYVAPRNKMCDYCGKAFQIKRILAEHINTHTGARPFVCKLCGADFGHRSALYLHGRYKHKIQKKNTNKIKVKKTAGGSSEK